MPMLIDSTLMDPDRRFNFEVSDLSQAAAFYARALNAEEVFRVTSHTGEPTKLGLSIGSLGFTISEVGAEEDPMTLSRFAAELGTDFVGLILYVADPEDAAHRAIEAGGRSHPEANGEQPTCRDCPVQVVLDPFGNVWAFAKA